MSNQYFENNENLTDEPHQIAFYYKKTNFIFNTNSGIFSKNEIDFGTRLLLSHIPLLMTADVLDIGCGCGVIGIVIAKVFKQTKVTLIDVNRRALKLSSDNANQNGVNNIKIIESHTYQKVDQLFDLIITNPPIRAGKEVVLDIIKNAPKYLKENGLFMCVINQNQGAVFFEKVLKEHFEKVEIVAKDKKFFVFKASK